MSTNLFTLVSRIFGGKKSRRTRPAARLARLGVEVMEGREAPASLALPLSPAVIRGFNPQPEPPLRAIVASPGSIYETINVTRV